MRGRATILKGKMIEEVWVIIKIKDMKEIQEREVMENKVMVEEMIERVLEIDQEVIIVEIIDLKVEILEEVMVVEIIEVLVMGTQEEEVIEEVQVIIETIKDMVIGVEVQGIEILEEMTEEVIEKTIGEGNHLPLFLINSFNPLKTSSFLFGINVIEPAFL